MLARMLYDPYSRAIQEDPFPTYRHFLEHEPCTYNPAMDFFALFRFEDVWEATLDWKTYSSSLGPSLENRGQFPGELFSIIGMDPPRHTRLRNLVSRGFTPKRIAALEDEVRRLAADYLEPLRGEKRFDVQQSFSVKLPMDVISVLLGIPEADRDWYRHTVDRGLERDRTPAGPRWRTSTCSGSRVRTWSTSSQNGASTRGRLHRVIAEASTRAGSGNLST
jgi:cytochrome P450